MLNVGFVSADPWNKFSCWHSAALVCWLVSAAWFIFRWAARAAVAWIISPKETTFFGLLEVLTSKDCPTSTTSAFCPLPKSQMEAGWNQVTQKKGNWKTWRRQELGKAIAAIFDSWRGKINLDLLVYTGKKSVWKQRGPVLTVLTVSVINCTDERRMQTVPATLLSPGLSNKQFQTQGFVQSRTGRNRFPGCSRDRYKCGN